MKRVRLSVLILLMLSFTLSGCGEWQPPEWLKFGKRQPKIKKPPQIEEVEGKLLASVNGRVITLEDFNSRIEAYNSQIQASADIPDSVKDNYLIRTLEDRKALLEQMIERELIISEAIERALDQDKDLIKAVTVLREQLLFARVVESEKEKIVATSKEVENYYNMYRDAFAIPEERRVAIIVVPNEQKAKELLIMLLQGSDFTALAREHSSDESAARGGDIGFIVRRSPFPQPDKQMVFEKLEDVAFSLEANKPSAVFKGPNGFYIARGLEIKPARQMLLSEVYADIEKGLILKKQEEAIETLIGNLRKSASIIVHENLLEE